MKQLFYFSLIIFSFVCVSCRPDSEEIRIVTNIGGFYLFINETTKDTILNEYKYENGDVLEARNGDSLSFVRRSGYNSNWGSDKCLFTFVFPDGSRQSKEGTIDKDLSYGFTIENYTKGRKTFLIIPELTDNNVKCTVGDKIVLFKLLVKE